MNRRPLKVCLLGGSFRIGNSVGALTAGTIECILHGNPDAEVSLLEYGTVGGGVELACHGRMAAVRIVNIRFSKRFYLRNNIARLVATSLLLKLTPAAFRTRKILCSPWLRHVDEADLVASLAGGDSFSDIYGLTRFFYVSLPQLLAIWMGRRLALLPQTIGPFKNPIARATARYILGRATMVYLRDRDAVKSVAALLGANADGGKLRFCYDLGFALEPTRPASTNGLEWAAREAGGRCRVGLNVSGLLSMGGYNRKNMFGLRVDYNELVRNIVELLVERKNSDVLLVPHLFGSGAECDSPACERVYAELKARYGSRLSVVRGGYDQSEIKFIIGQCDFFIGSRMHACIAAVSQCIPTVSIAYSDKFRGVMETLDAGLPVADARALNEAEILSIIDQAFEQRGTIHQHLRRKIPEVKQHILRLFDADVAIRDGCA
jgi:polysaccharide pyruvyl transferase WcaK-like protein